MDHRKLARLKKIYVLVEESIKNLLVDLSTSIGLTPNQNHEGRPTAQESQRWQERESAWCEAIDRMIATLEELKDTIRCK